MIYLMHKVAAVFTVSLKTYQQEPISLFYIVGLISAPCMSNSFQRLTNSTPKSLHRVWAVRWPVTAAGGKPPEKFTRWPVK